MEKNSSALKLKQNQGKLNSVGVSLLVAVF